MKIKLISTGISVFFERLTQSAENTEFLILRFLHVNKKRLKYEHIKRKK